MTSTEHLSILPERPFRLPNATLQSKIATDPPIKYYLSVSHLGARPYEFFIRLDKKSHEQLHEWVHALTLLGSLALQHGAPMQAIIDKLKSVHGGGNTNHFIGDQPIPSIVANIGHKLELHMKMFRKYPELMETTE